MSLGLKILFASDLEGGDTSTLKDLIAADAPGTPGTAGDRYVGNLFPNLSVSANPNFLSTMD